MTLRQAAHRFTVSTKGQGLIEITSEIADWLAAQAPETGLLTVYCRHTSASLVIQENADPSVQRDLTRAFARLAPESGSYEHDTEGPDDMPAHIKAALTQTSLSIPVSRGRLMLGRWQGLYLFEHRDRPHIREIVLALAG